MTTAVVDEIQLTDEQRAAVERLAALRRGQITLGGLAGTGKTTVIRALAQRLPGWAICAYTGKAADVLRSKGLASAGTIHSKIYDLVLDYSVKPPASYDPPQFSLVRGVYPGIIVDEASMVSKIIYQDLKALGCPLIFVGDHGQLPPVGRDAFNLMASPDIRLEKIHRNAGEIAAFAGFLRAGNDARDWVGTEGKVLVVPALDDLDLADVDQIICARNGTRVALNHEIRAHLGLPAGQPVVGDRVFCRQNDAGLRIFNGMDGVISRIDARCLTFDSGGKKYTARYHPEGFGSAEKPEYERGLIPFDWAYAKTCHGTQGSEYGHVLVIEERCGGWEMERWSYTAASRAKTKLTWVTAG